MYLNQVIHKLKPNIGTVEINFKSHNLFIKNDFPIEFDRILLGTTEISLIREPNMFLVFQHISREYGTRLSRVDLTKIQKEPPTKVVCVWSPRDIRLYVGKIGKNPIKGDFQEY